MAILKLFRKMFNQKNSLISASGLNMLFCLSFPLVGNLSDVFGIVKKDCGSRMFSGQ
jgi:hypothetical protein